MVSVGKYCDAVIKRGDFAGVEGRYFADVRDKALFYPFSNQDFEMCLPHSDLERISMPIIPEDYPFIFKSRINRFIGIDIVDLTLDLGFHVHIDRRVTLKGLEHSYTSDLKFLTSLNEKYTQSKNIICYTKKHEQRYGRWLATLFLQDGTNLNEFIKNNVQ